MVKVATEIFDLAKKALVAGQRGEYEAYMTCLAIVEKKVLEDEEKKWQAAVELSKRVLTMYEKRRDL